MVTIKDIARESGYSVSTVSRVLNHRSDVSPDAKKKIEEVVEKFHFVPNNNAKQLKQNNSKSIGVLVKGISNMLFASIVEEIQKMIEKTEYTLVVSYIDEDADEVEQAILLCRERKPLGLYSSEVTRSTLSVVLRCGCAVGSGDKPSDDMQFSNLSSVATDDVAAGANAQWMRCLTRDMKESASSAAILRNLIPAVSVSGDVRQALQNMAGQLIWKGVTRRHISLLTALIGE